MKQQQERSVIEAQATLRKALERQWRAWSALITELEGEVQAAERAKDLEIALFDAPPAPRANLPLATRKQLLSVFDARLQTAQAEAEVEARQASQPPPDAEDVRRKLIAHIARELRGEMHEKGLALIYWQGKLVPFDHRAIQRSTKAADYLAAGLGKKGGGPMQTVAIVVGGVGAILALLAFLIFVVLAPAPAQRAGGLREGRVGDQTVMRWDVKAAAVGALALRIDPQRVSYPVVVCAPEKQAAALVGTATLTGTESLRYYTLAETGADLRVVSCENPAHELARGTLDDAFTLRVAEQGRVREVWARGPDDDPQRIPANRMEVTLLVEPTLGESSLVLADGTALSPSERRLKATGLELTYLAPLSEVTQSAGLVEQVPGGLSLVTPVMLPAPEARLSYLGRVLTVTDAKVERDGVALRLTLTVRARADRGEALTIQPGDVRVAAGSHILAATWAPLAIAGDGTPQQFVMSIPASSSPVTVAVGTWQASLTP